MMERLCQNSHSIGTIANKLAHHYALDDVTSRRANSAGTLSHIGTLILAISRPTDFKKAAQLCDGDPQSIDYFERSLLGADHALIGSYFLGLWGFPLEVCEAVAFHHRPSLSTDLETPRNHSLLAILHLAQQLAKYTPQNPFDPDTILTTLDTDFLTHQSITIDVEAWGEIMQTFNQERAAS